MPEFIYVKTDDEYAEAARLFREYSLWLNINLCFQNFEQELLNLKSMYSLPLGGIILCRLHNEFIGCIAIRKQSGGVAELKRMYVQPALHHKGIGTRLLEEAVNLATQCGYQKIVLDTLPEMTPAINLYRKHGFYSITPYYYNPREDAVFLEKKLRGA
jgi:carbonic anhydrase